MNETPTRKCRNCGARWDLTERHVHVGGVGYVPVTECRDQADCDSRWNRQHGYCYDPERGLSRLAATLAGRR